MAKPGRKRKPGVERYITGRPVPPPRHEREANVTKTVEEQRIKHFRAPPDKARDARYGTSFGNAAMRWRNGDKATGIDGRQYMAAEAFVNRRRPFLAVVATGLPRFGSTLEGIIAGGRSSGREDDEATARIRSDYREIYDALKDARCDHLIYQMDNVLIEGQESPPVDWAVMRSVLNVIANRLKLPDGP